MVGNIDTYDGQQNLEEWARMVERTAEFTGWSADNTFKAALFRLRGEASEHIEQLKTEGQIKTWEDTKRALKARFETSGKEQLYQHLLNTGTQGEKTVQEWAQIVRKMSLKAVGANEIKPEGPVGNDAQEGQEGQEGPGEQETEKEAKKAVLNFMRKTNFIRGLRKNLQLVVWRKKCKTFEEAIAAAADEEALEMAHKEGEVLSCFQGDLGLSTKPLVNSIVAALEAREAAKEVDKERQQERQSNTNYSRRDEFQYERNHRQNPESYQRAGRDNRRYEEQLPLPRTSNGNRIARNFRGNAPPQHLGRYPAPPMSEEERRDWTENRCFNCHMPGHQRRVCPVPRQTRFPGNGPRRLN